MSPEQGIAATTALLGETAGGTAAQESAGEATTRETLPSAGERAVSVAPRQEHQVVPGCANCGADVPGNFCGRCGQRLHHELHSVAHFGRELAEDLTHADSRLWSTIVALLFKPGFLTREFIEGRRVRYLPPIRLYLVLSVVFFLVYGSGHHAEPRIVSIKQTSGRSSVVLEPSDQFAALAAKPGETAEERTKRVCDPHYDGPFPGLVTPFLQKGCARFVEDNGRGAAKAFVHTLHHAFFFFLPVLALVMKLLYRRPRRYYVEHLLFFLHNHAFSFLIFTLLLLVMRFTPSSVGHWAIFIVCLYVPYYLFVSMRQVYGQGRWRTFAKLTVLSFTYFIGGVLTLAMTGVYSIYAE